MPGYAEARWKRIAGELAKDPLFVDMDAAHLFDRQELERIRAAMNRASRRIGAPVYLVVAPNPTASESSGQGVPFLHGLWERLRRDGMYVLVDADGDIEAVPFRVPRRYSSLDPVPYELQRPADYRNPEADLMTRLLRAFDAIAAAPSGPRVMPRVVETAQPWNEDRRPLKAQFWGPFVAGLVLGALAALVLYGLWALGARLFGGRGREGGAGREGRGRRPAPARPTPRWLRAQATKELERLERLLPPDDDAPGRRYALRAYDAARILSDDVGPDPDGEAETVLDLVGVIVLARQGQTVLAEGAARPEPPCFVNPLHPPATRKRKIGKQGTRPVCATCAEVPGPGLVTLLLRTPDHRHHFVVPGRWQRNGFGTGGRDLAGDVLESLGVD
ncbi:MAG TPA: hypothetical protein VHJ17_08560 [Thermomonospora sp.]|nr:hypothetical protein [Thermomonospora sp.]